MHQASTTFLRIVVIAIGIGVLGLCYLIGLIVASNDAGMYIPIVIGLYVTVIPFYMALYRTLRLLRLIDARKAFSKQGVRALQTIKNCAIIICGLFTLSLPYYYYAAERDDAPGVILMGALLAAASLTIAVFATVLQKVLQQAIDIKAENDLTV